MSLVCKISAQNNIFTFSWIISPISSPPPVFCPRAHPSSNPPWQLKSPTHPPPSSYLNLPTLGWGSLTLLFRIWILEKESICHLSASGEPLGTKCSYLLSWIFKASAYFEDIFLPSFQQKNPSGASWVKGAYPGISISPRKLSIQLWLVGVLRWGEETQTEAAGCRPGHHHCTHWPPLCTGPIQHHSSHSRI